MQAAIQTALRGDNPSLAMDLYEKAGDTFFNGSRNRARAVEFYRVWSISGHFCACAPGQTKRMEGGEGWGDPEGARVGGLQHRFAKKTSLQKKRSFGLQKNPQKTKKTLCKKRDLLMCKKTSWQKKRSFCLKKNTFLQKKGSFGLQKRPFCKKRDLSV